MVLAVHSPVDLFGVVLVTVVAEVGAHALAAEPQLLLPVGQRVHRHLHCRPNGLEVVSGGGGRPHDLLELLDGQVRDDFGIAESLLRKQRA